jgi:molybdenum-dependent DNA-binding transcriptional regulator ModE
LKIKDRLDNTLRRKKRKVQQLNLNGEPIKTHESISQAAKAMKVAYHSYISLVCQGKGHTFKGYKWRYVD